jgi:sugar phosphate isomerase/epimerase
MKLNQVALQLYTLRDFLKTPADIASALKRVHEIGYQAVQISGLGPIPEEEAVRICRDNDLTICATHESGDTILNEPGKVVERLKKLGCRLTAYPYPTGIKFDSLDAVKAFCRRLNAAGKVLHEAGQILCYHNHHTEFQRVAGKPALEIIYAETDPRYLQGEPDTYWVQNGGGDPVEWCDRLKGRLPIIHLKDYTVLPDNKVTFTEIGNGNLNWRKIIAAAEAAGCQWYCVEQDTCPGDPFLSVKQSFEFIRDNLCSS